VQASPLAHVHDLCNTCVVKSSATRRRVLGAIMAQDATTASQLARLFGLTPAAVRRHLEGLQAEGLITTRQVRRPGVAERGRPATEFRITDAGRDEFQQAYGELAVQAIAQLIEAAGPAGLDALAKVHFGPIQDAFEAARAKGAADPLGALAVALDEAGYAADVTPLGTGEQLCQHHCPVAEVARLYPELCQIETQLIASLLQSHVQRLATIAHGDGVCTTSIPGRTI